MKPGKDEFMTLSVRIKNFTSDILEHTEIDYKIEIDSLIDKKVIDINARKNIIFFIKEAINNVVKYSKASTLNIAVKVKNNVLFIEIVDNGIGFETSEIRGNGIGNMKNRIEELKGEFVINSIINSGTTIKATIPIVT
jgi:signal transduction histidine kinase